MLSAIAVTPSVIVTTPLAMAVATGCDIVQWCAARTADVAEVVAEVATDTAEAARWVADAGHDA